MVFMAPREQPWVVHDEESGGVCFQGGYQDRFPHSSTLRELVRIFFSAHLALRLKDPIVSDYMLKMVAVTGTHVDRELGAQ